MHQSSFDAFPDYGLTEAQRGDAVRERRYEYPGMDGERGEIWCYTDDYAYLPGATVKLYVSSTTATSDQL